MGFGRHQPPGTVLAAVFADDLVGAVVALKPEIEVLSVPDVELSLGILDDIGPEHGALKMAPEVGFEPTTNRLTADRSTTELPRIAPQTRWIRT